ncbi:hypothetical protein B0H14DRAFT_3456205 [Mycena olivaceomarginata]|nr:hypothetical protein B0H14DRAFT_3456205 [Mycena olivaceomarginata]
MDAPLGSATNSDVLPGSANNPHVLDSPPRHRRKKRERSDCENLPSLGPGAALDPLTLEDSPPRPKRIYRGPPSTIVPDLPAAAVGPSREGPAVASAWRGGRSPARAMLALEASLVAEQREERRAERNREVTRQYAAGLLMAASSSLERERVRALLARSGRSSAVPNTRAARRAEPEGWRAPRGTPLAREDLYLQGTVAPEITALKNHHECSICHFVKTHPVSYQCGHSHCYACIRMWFEQKWTCPECVATVDSSPFRHYAEEAGIESEYPGHSDLSVVDYSWAGLVFPARIGA